MTVKWRLSWDNNPDRHANMSKLGKQRDGPGVGPVWDHTKGEDPPVYNPVGPNNEVDTQVAQLLNFAKNAAHIPESFWRNDSVEGIAAKKADNVYNKDDMRSILIMRLVRAMYSKGKCSFIHPRLGEQKDPDVYYFPEGAAFTSETKPPSFMTASVLAQNPEARMSAALRNKGLEYQKMSMLKDAQDTPGGLSSAPKAKAKAKASSGSASSSAPAMKRPAAEVSTVQKSSKKRVERDLDRMN